MWLCFFKTGVKDISGYVTVNQVSENIGVDFCGMLPAIHALAGSDSTSCLFSVGKVKPFKWARNHQHKALALKKGLHVSSGQPGSKNGVSCDDVNLLSYMFSKKQAKTRLFHQLMILHNKERKLPMFDLAKCTCISTRYSVTTR